MSALARAGAELEEERLTPTPAPPIQSSAPPRPSLTSSVPPAPASSSRMKPKAGPPPLPAQVIRHAAPATEPSENRSRVRVSVKTSVRDPNLLVVRRLDEGKALPPGTREGWLVMPESTNVDAAPHSGLSNGKSVR
jgi:hypothetical protein